MSKSEHKEQDKRGLMVFCTWLEPELPKRLRILAAEQEKTIQVLVTEFLNDGLAKYGKQKVTVRRVDAP